MAANQVKENCHLPPSDFKGRFHNVHTVTAWSKWKVLQLLQWIFWNDWSHIHLSALDLVCTDLPGQFPLYIPLLCFNRYRLRCFISATSLFVNFNVSVLGCSHKNDRLCFENRKWINLVSTASKLPMGITPWRLFSVREGGTLEDQAISESVGVVLITSSLCDRCYHKHISLRPTDWVSPTMVTISLKIAPSALPLHNAGPCCHWPPMGRVSRGLSIIVVFACELRSCFGSSPLLFAPSLRSHQYESPASFITPGW